MTPLATCSAWPASSEETRLLELFQLQNEQGPCLDCVGSGRPVRVDDIAQASDRWPDFVSAANSMGFVSVYAVPLRLRTQIIGGLNLFDTDAPPLTEEDERVAQALADMATIGLLQQQSRHRATLLAEQLQGALNSRVVIEQAKGVLAEYGQISMDRAFGALRAFARDHNRKLSDVAEAVVVRSVPLHAVVAPTADPR